MPIGLQKYHLCPIRPQPSELQETRSILIIALHSKSEIWGIGRHPTFPISHSLQVVSRDLVRCSQLSSPSWRCLQDACSFVCLCLPGFCVMALLGLESFLVSSSAHTDFGEG